MAATPHVTVNSKKSGFLLSSMMPTLRYATGDHSGQFGRQLLMVQLFISPESKSSVKQIRFHRPQVFSFDSQANRNPLSADRLDDHPPGGGLGHHANIARQLTAAATVGSQRSGRWPPDRF